MHSRRASRALRQLSEEDPTLAVLALWCQHRDMDDGLAETRGDVIHYGPRFEALSAAEQVGLAAHHVLHVACQHSARAQALADRLGQTVDQGLFPLAADALINETLLLAGYALPRPAVRATELIERALGERVEAADVLADWDAERLFLALTDAKPGRGRRSEDDPKAKARRYAAAQSFAADLKPAGAAGQGEMPDAAEWSERLSRALAAGRQAGRGLGALGITFADLPKSRTPWERVLRALLAQALIQFPKRAPTRPARGWLARDAAARAEGRDGPGFESGLQPFQRRPRLAVGVDMSTSVSDAVLARFAAELIGITRKSGAEVFVLPFDDAVRAPIQLEPRLGAEQLTGLLFARDGGTEFGPVLGEAEALDPATIVMLTDLDAPLPPAPKPPVIWAVPEPVAVKPSYGRVLDLTR